MEILFALSTILLVLFAILGLYDGFYLHIIKYRLYEHQDSKNEHLTHTIRALLFPAILYFLYLKQESEIYFFIGMILVVLDIITLLFDAYMEKDSRKFMGGLPTWEYIIHLLVNGVHFAAIFVFLGTKLIIGNDEVTIRSVFNEIYYFETFTFLVKNLIPGGILIGFVHLITLFPRSAALWNRFRSIISCC